jgi:hypothetical protein
MYSVVTFTLVMALMALLILGFWRVARALLSRSIYQTPSCEDESSFEQIERESIHWTPGMAEYSGDTKRACSPNSRPS